MKRYKIHYRKNELENWTEYDNVVYEDYNLALYIKKDIQEQFSNYDFEIYKI